jgi:monovalent cation:H+ antiporter-2, CPA2 family
MPSSLLLAQHGLPADGSQPLGLVLFWLILGAAILSWTFKRFRLEVIPGYLLAGALVGPHALGLVRAEASVEQVSALSTVLLMFGIGLHLDLESIRKGMVHIVAIGIASIVAFVLLFAGLLALLGVSGPAAVLLALAASLSSTAVLVRILLARRELSSSHGRITMGVSIVQDLFSVVVLAMLPLLEKWKGISPHTTPTLNTGFPEWLNFALTGALSISGVFLLLIGGRFLLPRLLQSVARVGSAELVLVASAAIALASAVWTTFLKFSPEMGAFIAGFLLASTPFRFQLSGQLGPVRDLLMAVFFTAVGMRVAPEVIASNITPIAIGFAALMFFKFITMALATWLAGASAPTSFISGIYLGNAGEFTLVVIAAGAAILSPDEMSSAIAVVILSLVATPILAGPAHAWAASFAKMRLSPLTRSAALADVAPSPLKSEIDAGASVDSGSQIAEQVTNSLDVEPGDATPLLRPKQVIIAGFGPVGRALADRFAIQGVQFTVVELNASTVKRQALLGRKVVYGDITNREVLEQAGIHHADAIILSIPDDEATLRACHAIRELAPHVFIAARTNFLSGKFTAMALGADTVTVEEVATAQAMEREVLEGLARYLAARAKPAAPAK